MAVKGATFAHTQEILAHCLGNPALLHSFPSQYVKCTSTPLASTAHLHAPLAHPTAAETTMSASFGRKLAPNVAKVWNDPSVSAPRRLLGLDFRTQPSPHV